MLVSETSAATFPLTRFRGLTRDPEKRAREPSSARVSGVIAVLLLGPFSFF